MKFKQIKNYNVVINNNESKDKQDIIILQEKGVFKFINGTVSFYEGDLLFKNKHHALVFKNFPTKLIEMTKKDIAQLVILEIDEDFQESLKGNIFYPLFDLNKKSDIWK